MAVQEGLVYSEDEAVIMVGTLADEHEVCTNHNHFPQFQTQVDISSLAAKSRNGFKMSVIRSVFEVEVC